MSQEQALDPRDLAWLEGPHTIGTLVLRPLTWGSLLLADVMDLHIVNSGGSIIGLTPEQAREQASLVLWMQSAEIPAVLQCLRDGTWEEFKAIIQPPAKDEDEDMLATMLLWIRRQAAILTACRFKLLDAGTGKSSPFAAHWLARKVHLLTQRRGWSGHHILWELPLGQAEQLEQCILLGMSYRTQRADGAPSSDVTAKLAAAEAVAAAAAAQDDDGW